MKDALLAQLFANSPVPALVCKRDSAKWNNEAFDHLSKPEKRALAHWACSEQGRCTLIEGRVFTRVQVEAYSLISAAPSADLELTRTLTKTLLEKLKQGSDPFYALPEILSRHLGWSEAKGVKLSTDNTLVRVGDYREGEYQAPKTLSLDSDPAARLYTGNIEACLIHEDETYQDSWFALRVDSSEGNPLGHFWLGKPNEGSTPLVNSLQLVQHCIQLSTAWLSRTEATEQARTLPGDPLTGLATREALDRLLQQCEHQYREHNQDFLLAMIDIDGLSAVNQSKGQRAGDDVLHQFADHLRHICRASDRLFRFGGDEFVILFHHDDLSPPLHERLERINAQMSKTLGQPFHSSYGTAALSQARGSGDELLLLADSQLRKAKSSN